MKLEVVEEGIKFEMEEAELDLEEDIFASGSSSVCG